MLLPPDPTETIAPEDDPLRGLPYRAVRKLGGGGMGEVFLAEHRQLGRQCVAKILHAHLARDPQIADRVRLAAQALGRISHPHIVSIIGAGSTADERPFIIMEQLRGHTLEDELADRRQLPARIALEYTCQLLRALAASHAIGIIHRNIKPGKLFLCDEGPGRTRTLKVLDFGIARVMPEASPLAPQPLVVPTDAGTVVGTPEYISPEAATGKPIDQRADLYAAALVLYRMVAGRGPFDHAPTETKLLTAQANEAPAPPSRFAQEPLCELDLAILRGLKKSPDERFQSADEMRSELERLLSTLPESPRRHSSPPQEPEEPEFEAEQAPQPSEELEPDSLALALPVRRISNLWLFVAAAIVTAAATAGVIALLVGAR